MPLADDSADQERQQATALAERILFGDWYADLVNELSQFLAPEVLARMTHPDITRNLLKSFSTQGNVLYSAPPTVAANGAELAPILKPELWPLRQHGNLVTQGLRDSFMRLDWHDGIGLTYRVVTPSYVCAWATAEQPGVPVVVREMRLRQHAGKPTWTRDTWDITNPAAPKFKIEVQEGPKKQWADVTQMHAPKLAPGAYPYMRPSGPLWPWVMYHPQITDRLWHWNDRIELVDATLKVGCLWTMWLHGCRDCAHPQRIGVDMEAPQAVATEGVRPVDKIALDQSAILMLRSVSGKNGSVTTLAPGMDPKAQADAILAYEAGMGTSVGLSAADIQTGGTNGMSGYAIVVSRSGQRRMWEAQRPAALMGDRQLLATAAAFSNAYGSTALPEEPDAYTVTYAEVERTADEIKGEMDEVQTLVDAGLMGPIDAVIKVYPSLDAAGALAKLMDIAEQKRVVAALAARFATNAALVGAAASVAAGTPESTPAGA